MRIVVKVRKSVIANIQVTYEEYQQILHDFNNDMTYFGHCVFVNWEKNCTDYDCYRVAGTKRPLRVEDIKTFVLPI